MKYFIANLSVHTIVALIFIVLCVIFANRNKSGKTKHPIAYFLPIVFCALAVVYTVFYTGPRLLDIAAVKSDNYFSYTGTLEDVSVFNNSLVVDGERYYINPLRNIPEEGANVKVRYTKYGHYVVEVVVAEEMDVDGSINEEKQTSITSTEEK
jgi:hypothetical protein